MKFEKGKTYEWNEILEGTGSVAGPVFYLLHLPGSHLVTVACLDIEMNPRAPYEIIPANLPKVGEWADYLCQQGSSIDVFVKELDGKRYFRGRFKVVGESSDKNEIALRGQQANRTDLYKIIFLAETSA